MNREDGVETRDCARYSCMYLPIPSSGREGSGGHKHRRDTFAFPAPQPGFVPWSLSGRSRNDPPNVVPRSIGGGLYAEWMAILQGERILL